MNRLRYLSYGVLLVICVFVFSGITYAYKSYSIGDEVTYNNIKFYVIKDSSSDEDSIILLKEKLLTVGEINK